MFIAIRFIDRRNEKVEVSERELTEHYIDAYRMILEGLNCENVTFFQAAIS